MKGCTTLFPKVSTQSHATIFILQSSDLKSWMEETQFNKTISLQMFAWDPQRVSATSGRQKHICRINNDVANATWQLFGLTTLRNDCKLGLTNRSCEGLFANDPFIGTYLSSSCSGKQEIWRHICWNKRTNPGVVRSGQLCLKKKPRQYFLFKKQTMDQTFLSWQSSNKPSDLSCDLTERPCPHRLGKKITNQLTTVWKDCAFIKNKTRQIRYRERRNRRKPGTRQNEL